MSSSTYDYIMSLNDADEFKALITKMKILSTKVKVGLNDIRVLIPDMFWLTDPGCGKTMYLRLLADFLEKETKLMDFYGDDNYVEFHLSYCSPKENFTEFARFADVITNAAGFRSDYRGIIHIEIDEWADHCDEVYFRDFLEYLRDNSRYWLLVLSVNNNNDKDYTKLVSVISAYLRLEMMRIAAPSQKGVMDYLSQRIQRYGLTLDASAEKLLAESIERLKKNHCFNGYKTLDMLAQDIVYCFMVRQDNYSCLSGEHLKGFSADSEYIKKRIASSNDASQRIGF